ncbi:MAG: hypothetical protein ACLFTK_03355 [Anaerolineales bacterium]
MKTPLVDLLNNTVPQLIAWCTPSLLHAAPRVNDIYSSCMSISYTAHGNPESPPWSPQSGVFGEAYRLAAEAYWGADYIPNQRHCLFSVNGSSGSNFMVIKALKQHFGPDLHILAERNLHKSLSDACEDYHVRLTYLTPQYHPDYQIFIPSRVEDFVQAFKADPSINVVLTSNPTYDGFVLDMPRLVRELRAIRDVIFYVDEAWGSNFYFSEGLQPPNALQSGVDISVISTHKQGGTLQQTGVILWRDAPWMIDKEAMFYAYRTLLTTSPSWSLLASIDAGRAYLQAYGQEIIAQNIAVADFLKSELEGYAHIVDVENVRAGGSLDVIGMDRTKILLDLSNSGISGNQLAQRLERRGIVTERSGQKHILLLVPFQRTMEDAAQTAKIMRSIIRVLTRQELPYMPDTPTHFYKVKEPYEVGAVELVPLTDAAGRVCGENITPYPPGVPLVMKGERFDAEHADYIRYLSRIGSTVLMYDETCQHVLVEK